jgi:hypothetical protein
MRVWVSSARSGAGVSLTSASITCVARETSGALRRAVIRSSAIMTKAYTSNSARSETAASFRVTKAIKHPGLAVYHNGYRCRRVACTAARRRRPFCHRALPPIPTHSVGVGCHTPSVMLKPSAREQRDRNDHRGRGCAAAAAMTWWRVQQLNRIHPTPVEPCPSDAALPYVRGAACWLTKIVLHSTHNASGTRARSMRAMPPSQRPPRRRLHCSSRRAMAAAAEEWPHA